MSRTEKGLRRNPHARASRCRKIRYSPQFERLEPRCLLAASPFEHYDIGTPTLTDLWVDPSAGNDANSGATRSAAVRTLAEAWNRVPSGETLSATGYRIQLVPGRYSEETMPTWWDARHGSFQCPIILQAADGPGTVTLAGMDVHDVQYMYLIGLRLEVRGGGGDVLHFASSDHVLVRDSELVGLGDIAAYDAPQESLKVNQSQYVFVEDSDISGAYWTAVDFVSVQHGHVVGSKIHRAGDWAMYFKGGSSYLRVEGNEIYDAVTGGFSAGQGTGFEFMVAPWLHYETYDVKFVNNVIHDTEGAGIGVNGSYNVLMAYNTMYRVGRTDHVIEVVHGLRGCDGNTAQCAANLAAGGWGTATPGGEERIPNKHIFIYDNIVYNPAGYQSQWQQFAIADPATPSSGSNIPNPSRADDDVQIRGNIIWNGPADWPLGIEGRDLLVTEAQLRADNAINTLQPELVDPAHGDFRPVAGGNVFSATSYIPPDFNWSDVPARPVVPPGDLSNAVGIDRAGNLRSTPSTPGAYAGAGEGGGGGGGGESQDVFFLHQSVGEGIMADHNGNPGLVAQIEAAGHGFGEYSLWNSPPGGSVPTEIASLFADQNGDGHYGDVLEQIPGATEAGVLMFKSCFYTLSQLEDAANLANWEQAFIDSVAPYANQHPQQKLVVMPAVPERKSSGLPAGAAARARDWSDWLAGDFITDYTTQHNVYSFNLFDFFADPASDARNANYQREEYLNSDHGDSHPNDTAYSAAADAIADYLLTTVIVGGTNHLPVASAQSVETPQDVAIAITLAATDSDGDPLTYEIVEGPASGTVDLNDNVATYTPSDGWHGDDHFTFRVYDGQAYSHTATVGITVYDPNPVVEMPVGSGSGSVLVRVSEGHLQVINQRNGRPLLDQAIGRLRSLTVTGASSRTDTLTVDLAAAGGSVLPDGLLFDGGPGRNTDTLTLRGTTGDDTFVLGDGSATVHDLVVRFSDVEQLTLDGGKGSDTYRVFDLSTKTTLLESKGNDWLDFSQATAGVTVNLASSSAQRVFAAANPNSLTLQNTFENVIGTDSADSIKGNSAANRIEGRGGDDRLWGYSGNDTLYGDGGNDTVFGGNGNDTLYGGNGDDWLYGEAGGDTLYGESGNNVLLGGSGNDRLDVSVNADSTGRNLLIGGSGSDTLQGGPGEEILIGGTTSYDGKAAALAVIMEEWSSQRTFDERCTNLANGVNDPTLGVIRLTPRTNSNRRGTALDDSTRDALYGAGGSDWFFIFNKDIHDRGPGDR